MGFALPHAEQASLDHLEAVRLQIREQEEQPLFRRRQGTVLVHGKPAGGPEFPIEAPHGHMRVERRLEGRDQLRKLVERHTRKIQDSVGRDCTSANRKAAIGGTSLLLEAQYIINRDKLN